MIAYFAGKYKKIFYLRPDIRAVFSLFAALSKPGKLCYNYHEKISPLPMSGADNEVTV